MRKLRTMHLFAGAGGGILGDLLLGHQPVCAVEINEYCQQVLSARQKDGCLPWFPIFADVTQFDGKPWRGVVDVVSGGFPCQDISSAGKGAGITGKRSGLWKEMARVVDEVRPRYVFVENSPALLVRGFERVLGDLAAMGFDARWGVLSGRHVGAPHARERLWVVANTNKMGRPHATNSEAGEPDRQGATPKDADIHNCQELRLWDQQMPNKSEFCGVADGLAHRVDRLQALGNGQISSVAATAWRILTHNVEVTGSPALSASPCGLPGSTAGDSEKG